MISQRTPIPLVVGALYASTDVFFFFPYVGLLGILHSIVVGVLAVALIGWRAPLDAKVGWFVLLLIAFCVSPIVASDLWQRVQDRIHHRDSLDLFIRDVGFYSTPILFRAAVFAITTTIIAVTARMLKTREDRIEQDPASHSEL